MDSKFMPLKDHSAIIDSSYFCSYFNEKDSLFERSNILSKKLEDFNLFTSNLILMETYTVLAQKAGKGASVNFGKYIRSQQNIQVLWVSELIEDDSWEIFKSIKSKNVSYVDCTTISLAENEGINYIVSFDEHFRKLSKHFKFKAIDRKG